MRRGNANPAKVAAPEGHTSRIRTFRECRISDQRVPLSLASAGLIHIHSANGFTTPDASLPNLCRNFSREALSTLGSVLSCRLQRGNHSPLESDYVCAIFLELVAMQIALTCRPSRFDHRLTSARFAD